MATKKPGITGIEPGQLSVPTMDRPSIAFAWFLDAMKIEQEYPAESLVLMCNLCGDSICDIEHNDTLRVLLNTALAHTC